MYVYVFLIGMTFDIIVVITILICAVIALILFIALFIYAQKHRAEKRKNLASHMLINAEAKTEGVI